MPKATDKTTTPGIKLLKDESSRTSEAPVGTRRMDWLEGYPADVRKLSENLMKAAQARGFKGTFLELRLRSLEPDTNSDMAPLAAWTAIKTWFDLDGHRKGVPLPPWCLQYLYVVASEMQRLRAGLKPEMRNHGNRERLLPVERLKVLPEILGFARPGWNIFDADDRALGDTLAALVYQGARDKGERASAALEQVMDVLSLADERSARRRIARGKIRLTDTTKLVD